MKVNAINKNNNIPGTPTTSKLVLHPKCWDSQPPRKTLTPIPNACAAASVANARARLDLGYSYAEVATLVEKSTAGAARIAVARAVAKLARYMAEAQSAHAVSRLV